MSLKRKAIQGSKATISGEALTAILRFGTIPIFARLITPDGYGLIAIAASLTAFLNVFMEGGLSTATLQRRHLSDEERSSLHWVNVSVGFVAFLLLVVSGPFVDALYDREEFRWILPCYGVMALIKSLTVQPTALLQREMLFSRIVRANVSSQVLGTAVGITLAAMGFGFWSLVVMEVVSLLIRNLMIRFAHSWRPSFTYNHQLAKPLLKFGAPIMLSSLLGSATRGIDVLLLGLFHSTAEVGLFERASRIVRKPLQQGINPIISVLRPALFAKAHSNSAGFERNVYLITRLLSLFGALIAVVSLAFAEQAIRILLGKQWLEAIPIFMALAPFVFSVPTINLLTQVIVSKGNSMPVLKWRVFSTVIVLLTVLVSVRWGALGVAIGISASGILIRSPFFMVYTASIVGLNSRSLFGATLPASLAMFVAVPIAVFFYVRGFTESLWHSLWCGPVIILSFAVVYAAFPSGRATVREAFDLMKHRRPAKPAEPATPAPAE